MNLGLLDGKSAIVTGSARGIGRATAELFVGEGAKVLINDLDGDVAEQAAERDRRRDRGLRRRPDQAGHAGRAGRGRGRRLRPGRHRRQQRRLHLGRRRPQDERRAVPGDARHPHDRALPGDPRARPASGARPPRQEAEEGKEVFRKIVNITSISGTMGNAGQANYSSAQGRRHRPDQDARQGVGPVQDQRATPSPSASSRPGSPQAKEKGETMQAAGESGEEV